MTLLRLYRRSALLAELELAGESIELGTNPGDEVRLDELGLSDASVGGRLERRGEEWIFTRRSPAGHPPQRIRAGEHVPLGEASFELEPLRRGQLLALPPLPTLPPGATPAQPLTPSCTAASATSAAARRFHALGEVVQHGDEGPAGDALLERALDVAFGLVQAEHGLVARLEPDERTLRVVASRHLPSADPRSELPAQVLERVLADDREFVEDVEFPGPDAPPRRAVVALPLHVARRVIGLLYVDRDPAAGPFSGDDLAFLHALALVLARRLEDGLRLQTVERQSQSMASSLELRGGSRARRLGWTSPAMQSLVHEAERVLLAFQGGSLPVLITGESGTGKELLARWLHDHVGRRHRGPFVALNCAAIPHDLAESELFGIEKGVASGVLRRLGRFEQAQGGTLFLDEIGEMTLPVQAKLLRALESRRIRRVGGAYELPVHVRIISATNSSLVGAMRDGRFREDLYWRLAGVELRMPALRERREDIPDLISIFAEHFAAEFGIAPPRLERDAMARLLAWSWPGNVRELRQRMGALTALHGGAVVDVNDLPAELRASGGVRSPAAVSLPVSPDVLRSLAEVEREYVQRVLDAVGGSRRRAADVLGIDRKTLQRKLARGAAPSGA